MMKQDHNITFTLGDTSGDGHSMTSTYHLTCNYSSEEIEKAYKKATEELGFDFVQKVCWDYEDNKLEIEYAKTLVEKDILDKVWLDPNIYINDEEEYIDIFFSIVKSKLPFSDTIIEI